MGEFFFDLVTGKVFLTMTYNTEKNNRSRNVTTSNYKTVCMAKAPYTKSRDKWHTGKNVWNLHHGQGANMLNI